MLLGITGFIYQLQGLKADRQQYPPLGELYEVNGQQMHLYAQGEGEITIVMASGHGTENPYVDFYPLHNKLSEKARVAVYDRFGYGWSDSTAVSREIDTITEELYTLLQVSGEKGPFLFVAHSISSLETFRFAQRYPDEVAGIVLLDAGNPVFYQTYETPSKAAQKLTQIMKNSGLLRVLSQINAVRETLLSPEEGYGQALPEPLKNLQLAMLLKQFSNNTVNDELVHLQSNAQKVSAGGNLGDLPLIWFTSGINQELIEGWTESQASLGEWSTNGKQIVLENAGHYVHHHEPELIIQEVLDLMKTLQYE